MTKPPSAHDRPLGMGLTSVVLGAVGLLLFFLPVLGIPLGCVGVAFGAVGVLMAIFGGWTSLRWSAAGLVVSTLALGMGLSIAQAPEGYVPTRRVPLNTETVPEHSYIPPPARPGT
jgi:hypothetical protein